MGVFFDFSLQIFPNVEVGVPFFTDMILEILTE